MSPSKPAATEHAEDHYPVWLGALGIHVCVCGRAWPCPDCRVEMVDVPPVSPRRAALVAVLVLFTGWGAGLVLVVAQNGWGGGAIYSVMSFFVLVALLGVAWLS